jgi:flagellar assembly protein FliH
MRNATRFTFDTVFHHGSGVHDDARTRAKLYTESEVGALCAEARVEGMRAGEIRAIEDLERAAREAAEAVRSTLAQTTAQMDALRAEAAAIALALARKVASAAIASFPAGEVEAALRQAMHQAVGEPRIVLHARPEIVAALSPRIAEIAQDEGYDGRVQITADPGLKAADCRIEWRGGGAERASAAIEAALEEIIARRFAGAESGTGSNS